jgi:hypothetical protein
MADLKIGKPDVRPEAPSHVKRIKQGNSRGNYEAQAGHEPDGTSSAERSTGINPKSRNPIDPSMPNLSPG